MCSLLAYLLFGSSLVGCEPASTTHRPMKQEYMIAFTEGNEGWLWAHASMISKCQSPYKVVDTYRQPTYIEGYTEGEKHNPIEDISVIVTYTCKRR